MITSKVRVVLTGIVLTAGLAACSTSPTSRLYVIEPAQDVASVGLASDLTIAVGPVTLPAFLDRSEIVTQRQRYRVSVSEFDRWAEPLEHSISAALAENLTALVGTDRIIVYPWDTAHEVDYTVRVRVHDFGVKPAGEVVLSASWMVDDADGVATEFSRTRYVESPHSTDMVATVAAMSETVADLSRDIATALGAL